MEERLEEREKKNKLSKVDDEVNIFHQLLSKLFSNLPDIKRVDYTHGQFERGADFILTTENQILKTEDFVGIIAKIGKIHQDLSKIKEQISECDLNRYVLNGKKQIRLDEIWVVTNDTITENAKEKIYYEYSTRKIKFLSNTELIRLIDAHLPNYWYDIPVEIGAYLKQISTNANKLNKVFSLLPTATEDFYIEHDLEKIDWDFTFGIKKKKEKEKKSGLYNLVSENKILFIEGKPGFGKSKLLRQAMLHYSNPIVYLKNRTIPVYFSYKELIDVYDGDFYKIITKQIPEYQTYLKEDNTIALFIDGFDEKEYSSEEEFGKLEKLILSLKDAKKIKAVISSRPLGDNNPQKYKALGISFYEILPLTTAKIATFFSKICEQTRISTRIIEDIKKSQIFKQLPRSPIAAILLANLINEQSRELPSNLTELYSKYSELMLGRWDVDKGLQSEKEYEAAKQIIIRMAKYFIENDLNYIAIDEAKEFFDNYLNERNLGIQSDKLFEKTVCRSGILIKEEQNHRVFFKHKTFAEYFYALYKHMHPDGGFISERVFDSYWRNVYFFYIGIKKDCEDILKEINNIQTKSDLQKLSRIANTSDYLLAGFATPYKVVRDIFTSIINQTVDLYLNTINKKTKNPLQELPEISLLFFFQALIRKAYSYEFFLNAIEDVGEDILSNGDRSDEEKAYAMFFLSVILIDLECENPFDGLIESLEDKIPLPIQFGVHYESKNLKSHSSLLKRREKKLTHTLKHSSHELRGYLRKIHELPIAPSKKKINGK